MRLELNFSNFAEIESREKAEKTCFDIFVHFVLELELF